MIVGNTYVLKTYFVDKAYITNAIVNCEGISHDFLLPIDLKYAPSTIGAQINFKLKGQKTKLKSA